MKSTPSAVASRRESRTQRAGPGRSSSQSRLQAQPTTSSAGEITNNPQEGSISSLCKPPRGTITAISATVATRAAVIPRRIAIPQSWAMTKPLISTAA